MICRYNQRSYFNLFYSDYCLVIKSNGQQPCNNHWRGGEIYLKINGELHLILNEGFEEEEYCLPMHQVDIENDQIQLQSSNDNAVCISSFEVNGQQLLVGNSNSQKFFWIDGNQNRCDDNFMSTPQITIQNGKVISSKCTEGNIVLIFCRQNQICQLIRTTLNINQKW